MKEDYRERTIFENGDEGSGGFSLEAVVRFAAQRMIQVALEAEVTEILQRLPGRTARFAA